MLYDRLPEDIQRIIRTYFTVWQRYGLAHQPYILKPDPGLYFRTIRKCPMGVWMSQDHLIFRRRRHLMQWDAFIHPTNEIQDIWSIQIRPQWNDGPKSHLMARIMKLEPWRMNMPDECMLTFKHLYNVEELINVEFKVVREDASSPPSRQQMADIIMKSIAKMADEIECAIR
jgi:hypothetical protein